MVRLKKQDCTYWIQNGEVVPECWSSSSSVLSVVQHQLPAVWPTCEPVILNSVNSWQTKNVLLKPHEISQWLMVDPSCVFQLEQINSQCMYWHTMRPWSTVVSSFQQLPWHFNSFTSFFHMNTDQHVCCTQEIMWQL